MKKNRMAGYVVSVILALFSAGGMPWCRAAEPKPLRVLVTFGGHGFEQKEYFAMWDALPGVTYAKAEMPMDADLLKPGLEKQYDVIVLYDMTKGFTPARRKAFTDLLASGIGLVATHHNLGAHADWPGYAGIIGGRYLFAPENIDGKEWPASTFADDQEIHVTIADKEHPITKGLTDFVIHDETYGSFYVAPDSHILLTTDHPKCGHQIAWTRQVGRSRVCYLMFGHGPSAWSNPTYKDLLLRAIRWAAP